MREWGFKASLLQGEKYSTRKRSAFMERGLQGEHPNFEKIFYPTPYKGAATETKPTCVG